MALRSSTFAYLDTQLYEQEVLGLDEHQTEECVDEKLQQKARELDISLELGSAAPPTKVSPAVSTSTISTTPRRSESIASLRSCSTGFTSILSRRNSKDWWPPQALALGVRGSTQSLVDRDGENWSVSSTPCSPVQLAASNRHSGTDSDFSLPRSPTYAQRKPFSVKRSFMSLSKLKRPSASTESLDRYTCQSCLVEPSRPRPMYRLHCYHSLCHPHLRQLVLESLKTGDTAPLYCCNKPISTSLLEAVSNTRERLHIFEMLDASVGDERCSNFDSSVSDFRGRKKSVASSFLREKEIPAPNIALEQIQSSEARKNLEQALQFSDYQQIHDEHCSGRDRFTTFERRQRQAMLDEQAAARAEHMCAQQKALDLLQENQPLTLARLEDSHISAEMDLRDAQEHEKRSCMLKLRHMEAYCNGHDPEGTGRTVTAQDKKELELQYWIRDHLDQRHQNAINVLREQQAKEMRVRAQKQDAELATMKKRHERERKCREQAFEVARRDFEDIFQRRRTRLMTRWTVEVELWRAKRRREGLEDPIRLPIANPPWPDDEH